MLMAVGQLVLDLKHDSVTRLLCHRLCADQVLSGNNAVSSSTGVNVAMMVKDESCSVT